MKRVRFLSFLLLVCIIFSAVSPGASALDEPILHAYAVVLADMESGNILYEKNMNAQRSPASLTKIMTGLLAVEAVERGEIALDDMITAPSDCWTGMDLDSSNAEISPGEKMTFQDYLYCALVKSANEACNVLAVAICGNIQNFVSRMNTRAMELGASHTYFSDTNGLSNENHYTTAYDLFLISREAMKHELFATIVNCLAYEIPATNTHAARTLHNSNALLCNDGAYGDGYLYSGASGVKTGYTFAAGYCLISTASRKDMNLICVVLGGGGILNTGEERYGNFTTSINLYDWGFQNFAYRDIIAPGQRITTVPVQYSVNNTSAVLCASSAVSLLLPKDFTDDDVAITTDIRYADLVAPISAGTVLGTANVVINGSTFASVPLVTASTVSMEKSAFYKAQLEAFFLRDEVRIAVTILLFTLLVVVFFLLRHKIIRNRYRQERREAEARRQMQRQREENLAKSLQAQEDMRRFRESLTEEDSFSEPEEPTFSAQLPSPFHDMKKQGK